MNASRQTAFPRHTQRLAPPPQPRNLQEQMHAANAAEEAADADWQEFLSLGLQGDPSALGQEGQWTNAPVMLSY